MKPEPILVVVDMQPSFVAARHPWLKRAIAARVREHKGPVCLLEYRDAGKTFLSIRRATEGKRVFKCTKDEDDGGYLVGKSTVLEELHEHMDYVLVGVNTPFCVLATANGLLYTRPKCTVTIETQHVRGEYDQGSDRFESRSALNVWIREESRKRKRRRFVKWA